MKPGLIRAMPPAPMNLDLVAAAIDDAEALVALRIEAMRPSLERIGRFDAQRARDRFLAGFDPACTRHVVQGGERIGFVVVKPHEGSLLLDHLYVQPGRQGRGVGAAVLARIFAEADAGGQVLSVGALRESDANRFYRRHGFECVGESEWDIHYRRLPQRHGLASGFVVFSGLPASGKSSWATALALLLGLPVLDKDHLLEALFDGHGPVDAARRQRLSRQADAQLQQQAMALPGALLVSWWRHPRSAVDSGTPVAWLASLPGPCVEVHCRCTVQTAAARFMARQRHAGHLDSRWTPDALTASFRQQAALGPLGIGRLFEVDGEGTLDPGALVGPLTAALQKDPRRPGET